MQIESIFSIIFPGNKYKAFLINYFIVYFILFILSIMMNHFYEFLPMIIAKQIKTSPIFTVKSINYS